MQSSASNTNSNITNESLIPRVDPSNMIASTAHPFAHSTAKLELIPNASIRADGIDVEAEAQLYDELCRTYEDETENVGPFDIAE